MIAKRIPTGDEKRGTRTAVAAAYGLTLDEFNAADADFVCSEGYQPNGDECDTLHDWLTYEPRREEDNTPWQKGDDLPY